MSQVQAKCSVYKVILPFAYDINQPSKRYKFDMDQVLTRLPINTLWV